MKPEIVKRMLLAIAIVVLVIIWSRNLLLFFPGKTEGAQKATAPTPSSSTVAKATADCDSLFVFRDDVRDPFQIPQPKRTAADSTRRKAPPPPPPEPPHASLIGIVWNAESPQVVVFDSIVGASVILTERQSINGYQVRSISKDQVILQSKRQRVVWKAHE